MTKDERDTIIEQCAAVIDQCNREGPFQAIAGAKRIRALKDEPHAGSGCFGKATNQTCGINQRKCDVCGFEPDRSVYSANAIGG